MGQPRPSVLYCTGAIESSSGLQATDGELVHADTLVASVEVNAGQTLVKSFRQGEMGYEGTVDTVLTESSVDANHSRDPELSVVAVDTHHSVIFGLSEGKRMLRGLGNSLVPPNVDHAAQMLLMVKTSRAYEANIVAMNSARQMYLKALELGKH